MATANFSRTHPAPSQWCSNPLGARAVSLKWWYIYIRVNHREKKIDGKIEQRFVVCLLAHMFYSKRSLYSTTYKFLFSVRAQFYSKKSLRITDLIPYALSCRVLLLWSALSCGVWDFALFVTLLEKWRTCTVQVGIYLGQLSILSNYLAFR